MLSRGQAGDAGCGSWSDKTAASPGSCSCSTAMLWPASGCGAGYGCSVRHVPGERRAQAWCVCLWCWDFKIFLHFLVCLQLCIWSCSGSVRLGSVRGILTSIGFESGALFSLLFTWLFSVVTGLKEGCIFALGKLRFALSFKSPL